MYVCQIKTYLYIYIYVNACNFLCNVGYTYLRFYYANIYESSMVCKMDVIIWIALYKYWIKFVIKDLCWYSDNVISMEVIQRYIFFFKFCKNKSKLNCQKVFFIFFLSFYKGSNENLGIGDLINFFYLKISWSWKWKENKIHIKLKTNF